MKLLREGGSFMLTSFMYGRKSSTLEGKKASPESNLSNGAYHLVRQARRPSEASVPGHFAAAMSSGSATGTTSQLRQSVTFSF